MAGHFPGSDQRRDHRDGALPLTEPQRRAARSGVNVGGLYPSELLSSDAPKSRYDDATSMETWVDGIVGCMNELPDIIFLNMQEMGGKHRENVAVLSLPDQMLSQSLSMLCSKLKSRYSSHRRRLWASRLVFCTGIGLSEVSRSVYSHET
eukprot:751654-Hanusia_phi.AAC.4